MTLTHERLLELLSYDEKTGAFIRLVTRGSQIKGSRAGWVDRLGYVRIEIDGCHYVAHRLAWFYVNREWPDGELDHLDANKANNSISNIRCCTRAQNIQNTSLTRRNTSGFKGAFLRTENGKWMSRIRVNGRLVCLGDHADAASAAAAYDAAAQRYFGAFARTNKMLGLLP